MLKRYYPQRHTPKMIEAEKLVDDYILRNGHAPSYRWIAMKLGITVQPAYNRLKRYRKKLTPPLRNKSNDN